MESVLKFRDVALFKSEPFGISGITFDIGIRKKVHLVMPTQDQLNTLLGILEERYHEASGIIYRQRNLFKQSDRLLLGDKVYEQTVEQWLHLADESFHFGGRKRTNHAFLDALNARHLKHMPIYRLRGDDRVKFTLLALSFQESGLILISALLIRPLETLLQQALIRLIRETECTLCLLSSLEVPPLNLPPVISADNPIETIQLIPGVDSRRP